MIAPSATSSSAEPIKWYENKKVLTVIAVTGLALGLLSLGIIVAAMGTSPEWYYQNHTYYDGSGYRDCIPLEINNASEIQNALQYGAQVGGVALGPCIVGFIIFALALVAYYKAHEKRQGKTEITPIETDLPAKAATQRRKNIALLIGFSIALFSMGLMIGSSTILHNGVSNVDHLIQQGRVDYPNAHAYWMSGNPSPDNFWDKLQSDWLNPTKTIMSGILPVSIFGALGGAGIMAAAFLGKGVFSCISCIKDKCTAGDQSDNVTVVLPDSQL